MALETNDTMPEQIELRLEEHSQRLADHDARFNTHAQRIDKYDLLLLGDDKLGVKGLVRSMSDLSDVVKDLVEWRTQITTYLRAVFFVARIALLLLGVIAGGVWWPQIQIFLKMLGG